MSWLPAKPPIEESPQARSLLTSSLAGAGSTGKRAGLAAGVVRQEETETEREGAREHCAGKRSNAGPVDPRPGTKDGLTAG